MYLFYINAVQLPIPPSKIEIKTKSRNKTIDLINEGEVSVLKQGGLKEISFKCALPRNPYPFSTKVILPPEVYIQGLEALKQTKKVFQFIIIRTLPNGIPLIPTNIKCTLEDFSVIEDANNGLDVDVSITLKQYKHYGLKEINVIDTDSTGATSTANVKSNRSAETAPNNTTYTIKKGDCLYNIAKKELGDGSRWKEIFNLNKSKISNPNLIYPNQKITLPNK